MPYPVQIDGTEILMEWITVDGDDARPRARPDPAGARPAASPTTTSCATHWPRWCRPGVVHGDLSAYNILAAGERLVIIDLPQIVDLVGNVNGFDFLMRDCTNICALVPAARASSGADEQELFGELMAHAF